MTGTRFAKALSIVGAVTALFVTTNALAKGLDATRISLPKGPGSVEGLGKNFTPSLASGTASYGVDIAVPPAAAGFAPKLSLDYDSGGGISDLGIGWQLGGVPEIRRRTENGLPKFDATDAFEIAGFGAPSDLLEIATNVFRPQYESGAFVRVQRSADGKTWEARDKSGTTYRFGGDGFTEEEGGRVATWLLREQLDVYGHSIKYSWKTDGSHGRLDRVVYNDFSPEARNEVVLKYEPRPDPHTRFTSGIKEEFNYRVTAVEVIHGGALVRRYELAYKTGLHSQLATVTLVGSDGVTKLPTLSLSYAEPKLALDAGGLVAMKSPPGRSPADANVDLADLDGDGLPDLLVTSAGAYRTYLNHDGLSWKPPMDWGASASPSLELSQIGVQLADLDGDGAIDLVAKSGTSYFRYFPGRSATSFATPVSIKTVPNFTFEDADVRVADMDGDRRADVVVTTSAGIAIGYNKNGVDWTEPATVGIVDPKQPLRFSDGKTQLCDVNGDRVQDLCYLRSGSLVYWLGRGRGKFEPAKIATGVPEFDSTAPWQLVDLDGDGWLDLVHVGVSNVQVSLATGEGVFGPARTISGTPTKGPSGVVKFADMNGTGTTDIVWIDVSGSPETAWRYLELFPEGRGGLLRTIDNGLGKRVTITYGPASKDAAVARDAGKPWSTRMNTAMPVVKAIELDSGLGDPIIRTEYVYRDGTFSPAERTFAGFAGGVEKAVGDSYTPTLLTDSTFDVGVSDRTLRGVLLATESRDEKGYIFTRSASTWTTRALEAALDGRVVSYSYKRAERVEHVEGTDTSKARVTLTEWEQDNFGNVTAEKKWGEVVGDDKLAGNDEAIVVLTFANNTKDWILGRVATEELRDGRDARARLRRLYYDGPAFEGLPLGQVARGNLSREEGWVSDAKFELVNATRYDADGNVVETRDARGGGRLFEWDPITRAFVVAEGVKTGTRVLTQRATYHAGLGTIVSFTNFNGAVSSFGYDALGRVVSIVKPGDSVEKPTVRYAYELSAPLSRVSTEARKFSGHDDVERAFSIVDGLGRKRAMFADDGNGRWAVSDIGLLDARGNVRRALIPTFVQGDLSASILQKDGPGHDTFRDALGRAIRTRSQLGIEARAEFAPFVTKQWDGAQLDPKSAYEHVPVIEWHDGLGRLVALTRTVKGTALTSSYGYDAAGTLLWRSDPEKNLARYGYDGLGRRVLVEDPDAGKYTFVYDATGNLTEQHAPDGLVRRYAYDLAGRSIAEDWDGDTKPEVLRTYDQGGDLFLGLLSSAVDPSGGVTFTYDARQRITDTVLTILGTSYRVGAAYDAQDRKYLHKYPDGSSIRINHGPRGVVVGYGNGAVRFAHDADGREVERAFNTGVVETGGYDADRRRVEHRVKAADGVIVQHLEWTLDGVGNILELRDRRPGIDASKDRSEVYGYDNTYRLVSAKGRWGETAWAYSASGNLVSRASTDPRQHAGTLTYGKTAGPHALTSFRARAIAYDARGRMLDDGERSYGWDGADHLVAVKTKAGATQESIFDGAGARRVRVERDAAGQTHTTHFVDVWSEVRDGKLVRYIVHGDQRIVRLADGNGAPGEKAASSTAAIEKEGEEPPGAAKQGSRTMPLPVEASSYFIAVALIAALLSRYRRQLARGLPAIVPVAVVWLLAATTSVGCKGSGEEEPKPPIEQGTILVLGERDEILFSDAIGSLTETTSGSGKPKATTATFPYGLTRFDSSSETRKFANTPRDQGVGLDHMGARSYAPELGVWTSVDPLALAPDRLVGAEIGNANAYAYGGANPVRLVDRDGHAAGAIALGAAIIVGVVFTAQYANAPSPTDQLYHKSGGEMALDMAHNTALAYGTFAAGGAVGGAVRATYIATESATAAVVAGTKVAAEIAVVGHIASNAGDVVEARLGPDARKVFDIAVIAGGSAASKAKTPEGALEGGVGRTSRIYGKQDKAIGWAKSKDASGVPRCEYCGKRMVKTSGRPDSYEADHRDSWKNGGGTTQENLAPACRTCNRSKGGKTLYEQWIPPKDLKQSR
ncbi:MAG: VCBS repeat-containing protein [Deltaproteobacteria bacterium]|nr:VCBS repeat-containing protein [Deltaproteobacteria bacterium]